MREPDETLTLGIVLERRPAKSPWADEIWRVVGILPGAAPVDAPVELVREGAVAQYHAATLSLDLHRKDTDAYRVNLGDARPRVFVVLRPDGPREAPMRPVLATVAPYEAQCYGDNGDDVVDTMAMTPEIEAWLADFVARNHQEQPFYKRQRDKAKSGDEAFARPSPLLEGDR